MKRLLLLTIMAALCLCPMDAQKQKRSGKRPAKESTEAKAERLFNEAEDFYFGTDKVFMNREKAAELYRQSAELGYPPAMYWLGYGYLKGVVMAKDGEKCAFWFRKAAEANNADAQYGLATCYADGFGVPVDSVQSVYWLEKSAENGNAAAQCGIGMMYNPSLNCISASLKRAGYQYDIDKAIYWLKKAAEQEYSSAFWELANIYHEFKQNEDCVHWSFKAADEKIPEALYVCGLSCYDGEDGFPKDRDKAFKYLSYLANNPDILKEEWRAATYFNLASCYFSGSGTELNDKLAFKYYSLVPKDSYKDYSNCPVILGNFYEGLFDGAPYKDDVKAMEYYKMVMEYNAGACYCYAVQLWKGTAGKYKCKEGLKMLREMARAGMEPAIEYLNSIGQKY